MLQMWNGGSAQHWAQTGRQLVPSLKERLDGGRGASIREAGGEGEEQEEEAWE